SITTKPATEPSANEISDNTSVQPTPLSRYSSCTDENESICYPLIVTAGSLRATAFRLRAAALPTEAEQRCAWVITRLRRNSSCPASQKSSRNTTASSK